MSALSFELTDERGRNFTVKHKKFKLSANVQLNNYLQAGQSITKTLIMDPDTWEKVPVIEPGKLKKYKARIVFDNDGSKIYSEYYTIILDGT